MLATLKQNGYGIMIDKGLNEMVWYGQVHIRKTERVKLYNRSMVTVIMQAHVQIGGYGMMWKDAYMKNCQKLRAYVRKIIAGILSEKLICYKIGVNGNGNKLGLGTNSYGMIRKSE